LNFLAIRRRPLSVIEADLELLRQHVMESLGFFHRRHVDDTRSLELAQGVAKNGVLDLVVDGADYLEAQVRTRKPRDRDVGIDHSELSNDVGLDVLGGSSGQSQNRWPSKSLGDAAEREVIGAEIVPPLAHAVRFVDDEETDWP